jgi:hypothetical protein
VTRVRPGRSRSLAAALAITLVLGLGGCGLNVQLPDLFLLTRTGEGTKLTLDVNDDGTIHCNRGKARTLPSALLIQARDLADSLAGDATAKLSLPVRPGTIFSYVIRLQQGTIRFTDRDTLRHKVLAQAELFAAETAQQVCGLSG